jgi:hypothetical protein
VYFFVGILLAFLIQPGIAKAERDIAAREREKGDSRNSSQDD